MKRPKIYILVSFGVCTSSLLALDFEVIPSLRTCILVNIEKKIEEEVDYKKMMVEHRNETRDPYDKYLHNQEIQNSEARLHQLRESLSTAKKSVCPDEYVLR